MHSLSKTAAPARYLAVRECVDTIAESQQRSVDVCAFAEPRAAVGGNSRTLGPREIHQRQLAHLHVGRGIGRPLMMLNVYLHIPV